MRKVLPSLDDAALTHCFVSNIDTAAGLLLFIP